MLDIGTIVAMLAVTSALICVALVVGTAGLRSPAITKWNIGLLGIAIAWTMVLMRGHLHALVGLGIADALILAGLSLQIAALLEFEERRAPLWLLYAPGPVLFAMVIGVMDNYPAFTVITSGAFALAVLAQAAVLLTHSRAGERQLRIAMATAYLLGAMMLLLRAGAVVSMGLGGIFEGDQLVALMFVVLFESVLMGSFGLLVLQRIRREHDFRTLSLMDGLTGLFNRRAFFDIAAREMARARRSGMPVAVIMLDLDHFKQVNDVHGHAAGDRVLEAFASAIRSCLRAEDVAARYGGEEFVVLCPNATPDAALGVAERMRRAVESARLGGVLPAVTVSAGVAMMDSADEGPDRALGLADAALYAAKHQGRNRVVAHESASAQGSAPMRVAGEAAA